MKRSGNPGSVRKTPLFEPLIYKMHLFTKTGSGQTYVGKTQKNGRFLAGSGKSFGRWGQGGGWYLLRSILV
jgi:hypothetical protein